MNISDYCENVKGVAKLRVPISTFVHDDIVTDNPTMLEQLAYLEKTSMTSAPIMIYGEKGSGKDLYAKYAHNHSPRKNNQFSDIRCTTIPDGFYERTFFGGELWSSMGREGLLRRTNYGTLFLSDVDTVPTDVQYKLYEALSGNSADTGLDIRVIASINTRKESLPFDGLIEELFYYLNVIRITLPPLRERPEDMLLLIFYFLNEINADYRMQKEMSWEILNALLEKDWGGEIKQLKNIVSKLVWMTDGNLISNPAFLEDATALQTRESSFRSVTDAVTFVEESSKTLKEMVHDYEVMVINQYIQKYGSLRKAAKALGASPASLSRKLNLDSSEDEE